MQKHTIRAAHAYARSPGSGVGAAVQLAPSRPMDPTITGIVLLGILFLCVVERGIEVVPHNDVYNCVSRR